MDTITGSVGVYNYFIDQFGDRMEVQIYMDNKMVQAYEIACIEEGHRRAQEFSLSPGSE